MVARLRSPVARSALLLTAAGALGMLGGWQVTLRDAGSWRGSAPAVIDPALERRVESIVERLGSPEWQVRETASSELMALPMPEAQAPIVARLERGDLDPEQRHRLVDAASRRLIEQPRGAIGISMDGMRGAIGGVRVAAIVPGMPAAEVLRVGDVIETINDQPILSSAILSDIVQRLAPETAVRIRVQRPVLDEKGRPRRDRNGLIVSQPLDLLMRLGSMEQLDNADRAGRGGIRANSDVQMMREQTARQIRREFAARATMVQLEGLADDSDAGSFASSLQQLERMLGEMEGGGLRTRPDAASVLQQAAQRVENLHRLTRDSELTDRDRQRLALVLQRLATLLSDDSMMAPIDRLDPRPAR